MIRRTKGGLWYVQLREGGADCVCLRADGNSDTAEVAKALNQHMAYACARLGVTVLIRQEDVEQAYQETKGAPE